MRYVYTQDLHIPLGPTATLSLPQLLITINVCPADRFKGNGLTEYGPTLFPPRCK